MGIRIVLLAGILGQGVLLAADGKSVWVDELDVGTSTCGWQRTLAGKSVGGQPLRLRGKTYQRGIGTHANGLFRIDLGGKGLRFRATAGIDDESGDAGTVEFRVEGDGKVLWNSGVLKGQGEIKPCDVPLDGVNTLDLVVDTTPDGYGHDHADWVDARIEYTGDKAPVAVKVTPPKPVYAHRWPPADQVFNTASLPDPADRDELDAVLRRTGVLLAHLKTLPGCPSLKTEQARLAEIKTKAARTDPGGAEREALLPR